MENLAKVSKERDAARAERAAREAEARALETRLEQESKRLEGLRAEVADMTDKYTARLAELQAEHRAAVAGSEQLVKDKDALAERRAPSRTRPASGRCGGGAERWRRRAGTGWRRRLRRRRAHGRSERACRGSWQSYARASPRRAPRRLPSAPARAPARCPPQRGGGAVCQLSGQQRIGSANTGGVGCASRSRSGRRKRTRSACRPKRRCWPAQRRPPAPRGPTPPRASARWARLP